MSLIDDRVALYDAPETSNGLLRSTEPISVALSSRM